MPPFLPCQYVAHEPNKPIHFPHPSLKLQRLGIFKKQWSKFGTLGNFFPTAGKSNRRMFVGGACVDWCCFYYFARNSQVALLEALCAQLYIQHTASGEDSAEEYWTRRVPLLWYTLWYAQTLPNRARWVLVGRCGTERSMTLIWSAKNMKSLKPVKHIWTCVDVLYLYLFFTRFVTVTLWP